MAMQIIISSKMKDLQVGTIKTFITESDPFIPYHCKREFWQISLILDDAAIWEVFTACFVWVGDCFNSVYEISSIITKKVY